MTTIDEAVQFFEEFFEAELKVLDANLSASSSFEKLRARMQSKLSDPNVFEIHQKDHSNLKGLAKAAVENTRKVLATRQIYLVEEHRVGKRKLFCAYTSAPRRPENVSLYERRFWADDTAHIVAVYFKCAECQGMGKAEGAKCSECGGVGWLREGGEAIKAGKPTAVKKLVRPSFPFHAEHYDQL